MKKQGFFATLLSTSILMCNTASAHVTVNGAGVVPTANKTFEATLNVPHGCGDDAGNHFDTQRVETTIPTDFVSVLPVDATFGKATVIKNETGAVTKIVWAKTEAEVLPADDHFYKLTFRGKLPDKPFTKIAFPTVQHCIGTNGVALTSEWTATEDGEHDHNAPNAENPAPTLFIYPARSPGWNKYTVNEHVHDLSVFADAEIVWAGTAAYSANAITLDLIKADTSVTVLDAIHPGTEIWVKY